MIFSPTGVSVVFPPPLAPPVDVVPERQANIFERRVERSIVGPNTSTFSANRLGLNTSPRPLASCNS
jgi:hypothetical protein